MIVPLPFNEAERLVALYQSNLLDSAPEATFDNLVLLTAQLCDVPIALITLIDANRQWFKAKVGLTWAAISREVSFCAHAILQPDQVLVVSDTLADERFATNPLVTSEPYIRFYAGVPLVVDDGYVLGTLCVIDHMPRELSHKQMAALQVLGHAVATEIQTRRNGKLLNQAIDERDLALAAMQEARTELETETQEHTTEFWSTNEQLQRELAERQHVEAELHDKMQQLDLAYRQATIYAKELKEKIAESKQAQQALEEEQAYLAQRVAERTSELSLANAELARTARAKDEFLAMMSHELRTPLNAILGLTEILQAQTRGPLNEDQCRYLRIIEESGQHLLALINDILDVAKIEAGKLELQPELIPIETVCQASLRFIKEAAFKKNIKISYSLDPALFLIHADARRLKQILVNLLNNAVKFTSPGGQIGLEVKGEPEQGVIQFIIWDTGIGIVFDQIPCLFQPFVQIDSSLSRSHEGTGLGLALVSRLVEMHGGSISVESDGIPGRGSRFTVSLPWRVTTKTHQKVDLGEMTSAMSSSRQKTSHLRATCGTEPPLILLAEDNEVQIQLLTNYLESEDYRVVVARNGAEAVARANEEQPALILMDIQMPDMNGLEAIRRLRAKASSTHTPIIALTALVMPGDRERCLAAGATDYLSKPVSLRKLVSTISTYFESPHC